MRRGRTSTLLPQTIFCCAPPHGALNFSLILVDVGAQLVELALKFSELHIAGDVPNINGG